jgi:L-asparagine transporter-like permease
MQIRKLKFYSVWGRFWNWIIRIILIAIIIALLFNFNLNPKGFIVGIIIALLLIVYLNDDLIEIEDNGIFLSRNYCA